MDGGVLVPACSNANGGDVNAGDARMTVTASAGGLATPRATTSPSGAYPDGGRGRQMDHPAAPLVEPPTPSSKPPAASSALAPSSSLDQTLLKTRHGATGADANADARRADRRESSSTRSFESENDSGDAPRVIRASSS